MSTGPNKENSIFSRVLTKILNLLAKLSISLAEKLKDTKLAIFALGNPEIKHKLQKIGEEVQVGITSYSFQDKHQSSQQKHQDRLLSQRRSSCEGPSI